MSCNLYAGLVYMTGGCSSDEVYEANSSACDTMSSRLDIYDPQKDSWVQKASAPRARNRHGSATYNNKLYLFGGRDEQDVIIGFVDVYDMVSNSWSTLADNFTYANSDNAVFVEGSVAYIMGGYDAYYDSLNATHLFFFSNESFVYNVAQMPRGRGDHCAEILEGDGYIFGGFQDTNFCLPIDYLEKLHAQSLQYTSIYEVSTAPDGGDCACIVMNNRFYVFGGEAKVNVNVSGVIECYSDPVKTAESYDPSTDKWTVEQDMTLPFGRFRSCALNINQQFYIFGGQGPLTLKAGEYTHSLLADTLVWVPSSSSDASAVVGGGVAAWAALVAAVVLAAAAF